VTEASAVEATAFEHDRWKLRVPAAEVGSVCRPEVASAPLQSPVAVQPVAYCAFQRKLRVLPTTTLGGKAESRTSCAEPVTVTVLAIALVPSVQSSVKS